MLVLSCSNEVWLGMSLCTSPKTPCCTRFHVQNLPVYSLSVVCIVKAHMLNRKAETEGGACLQGNCTCLPEETFKWAGSDKDTPCADHEDPTFSDIAAPLPLKPRQCLIEVQQGGLRVVGRLLLEGIYFKRVVPQESDVVPSKLIQVRFAPVKI